MSRSLKNFDTNESAESELLYAFSNLTSSVEKKASLHWHIKSFEDYNREGINPFGLWVQIFPSFEKIEKLKRFKTAWEQVLKQCSTALMQLLITAYGKRIRDSDAKIHGLNTQIVKFKTHSSILSMENKLKEHLEKFNKDILVKKDKKF